MPKPCLISPLYLKLSQALHLLLGLGLQKPAGHLSQKRNDEPTLGAPSISIAEAELPFFMQAIY